MPPGRKPRDHVAYTNASSLNLYVAFTLKIASVADVDLFTLVQGAPDNIGVAKVPPGLSRNSCPVVVMQRATPVLLEKPLA